MHEAGIQGDTISYTTVINACAQTGDVEKAESWLVRMLESNVEPNTITFNAVIAACAKKGDGRRANEWLEKMRLAGILPNSFSYNTAAKAHAARGDYRRVEELMAGLRADGLPYDDFCLATLLHGYSNAKPKQRGRAEATFRELVAAGVSVTHNSMQALSRVLGRADAEALIAKCGVDLKAVEASSKRGGARR